MTGPTDRPPNDGEFEALLAASSFGSEGVAELSARTSDGTLAAVQRKTAELRALEESR